MHKLLKNRKNLAYRIEYLYAGKISWDEYDEYLKSVKELDKGALDIAQFIWEVTDPENTVNNNHLNKDIINRILLFLKSDILTAGDFYLGQKRLSFGLFPPRVLLTYEKVNEYWPFSEESQYVSISQNLEKTI